MLNGNLNSYRLTEEDGPDQQNELYDFAKQLGYNGMNISMKKIFLYILMFFPVMLAATPLIYIFSISALAYGTLRAPQLFAVSDRSWTYIAQSMYYTYEASMWMNQNDCVEFDEVLVYKPSAGCYFSNPEYETRLTFSQNGRTWNNRVPLDGKAPIFLLGDSVTMGWGVNDNETFSYLLETELSIPIYNLAVASYGTAREILWAKRHPEFKDAEYIIIQYHRNDLRENKTYLMNGSLGISPREKFLNLVQHEPVKLSYFQVLKETFRYISYDTSGWLFPVINFARTALNSIVASDQHHDEVEKAGQSERKTPRRTQLPTDHADVFLEIVDSFTELKDKTIFVWGNEEIVSQLFSNKTNLPQNIIPLDIETAREDSYILDAHYKENGHRKVALAIKEALDKYGALN